MDKEQCQEYLVQGKTLIGQEKYEAALSFLKKAEACDNLNLEVYLSKGLCYSNLDRLDEAKGEFEKALKINRQSGVAMFHLGNIYMLQGDRSKGLESYNNAIAFGYDDAQIFFTLGLFYEEEENDDLAMRNYAKAIHKDPTRPEPRIRKIRMLIRQNEPEQALQAVDEMLIACPDVFEGYHLRFLLLLDGGLIDQAEETINTALDIFPEDVGFAIDKGVLLARKGEYEEALNYLNLIEHDMDVDAADQRNIAMQRAKIAASQNDMPKTLEALERAKQITQAIDPENLDTETAYMLMNCYMADNQLEKAKENAELLKTAAEPDEFSIPAWYYIPYILKQMGKEEEAKPLYQEAIEKYRNLSLKYPGGVDFYVFRILSLRDLKQYEKALELADYLVQMADNVAETHIIRASVLMEMGNQKDAEAEQKRAQELGGVLNDVLKNQE